MSSKKHYNVILNEKSGEVFEVITKTEFMRRSEIEHGKIYNYSGIAEHEDIYVQIDENSHENLQEIKENILKENQL